MSPHVQPLRGITLGGPQARANSERRRPSRTDRQQRHVPPRRRARSPSHAARETAPPGASTPSPRRRHAPARHGRARSRRSARRARPPPSPGAPSRSGPSARPSRRQPPAPGGRGRLSRRGSGRRTRRGAGPPQPVRNCLRKRPQVTGRLLDRVALDEAAVRDEDQRIAHETRQALAGTECDPGRRERAVRREEVVRPGRGEHVVRVDGAGDGSSRPVRPSSGGARGASGCRSPHRTGARTERAGG